MAVINPPAWQQAPSYPARNDRLALSGLLGYPGNSADEASPMRVRSGVKPSYQQYQLKVRAAGTPNMTVIVSGGFVVVDQRDTGGQGVYVCANDGDATLNVAAAGGAGQFRKDCVVASVYDAEYVGAVSEWRLEVIQGPYAASAGATVRGALPPNCVPLADLAIGPSQTSVAAGNITDVRVYAVASGGILPVASSATPARPHPGQVFYQANTDTFMYGTAAGALAALVPKATAWAPIVLSGAWAATGLAGDGPPSARITHDGALQLSGLMTGVAVNPGANASVGTIPAALIPSMTYWVRGLATTSVAQNYARIAVNPTTGAIVLTNGSVAVTSGGWVQLDGVAGRAY